MDYRAKREGKMAIVWITGAHGFVGRHLARYMAGKGHSVCGLGHGHWTEGARLSWGISHWLNGDIEHSNLQKILDDHGAPDVIFHLAGGSSVGNSIQQPLEDFRRSVDSTALLLNWMNHRTPETRLVYISSAAVYGAGHRYPICENSQLKPFSPYGHHKAMAEQLCRCYAESFGLSISIVRFFSVYGPELRKQLIWDVCTRLMRDSVVQLGGSGHEQRDWLYIEDAVRLLEKTWVGVDRSFVIVNGGTGHGHSVAEVINTLVATWGEGITFNFSGQSRSGDPQYLVADPAAMASLGFYPQVSLEDGMNETVAWFKTQFQPD
jgi:UDP-glucose 4-epimerase